MMFPMKSTLTDPVDALPDAVKNNIESVATFYEREEEKISLPQSAIESVSCFFGSPIYFYCLIAVASLWIGGNLTLEYLGRVPFDRPPFIWLQGAFGINSVLIAIAVLIRQSRIAKVAKMHAHLSLQLQLLTEQKVTKVIQLLDALRTDMPNVGNKYDRDTHEMKQSTDPHAVLDAIEAHRVDM